MRFRRYCVSLSAVMLMLSMRALVVDANAATITWVGDDITNSWDAFSPNWTGGLSPYFGSGDDVTFNDSGSNSPDVNLAADLMGLFPGSVTVNNSAGHDYVFAGEGFLSGSTGITKSGTGTLIVNNANLFSGVVTVNAGTLRLGHATALGSPVGGTVVNGGTAENPGGTLDLGGAKTLDETITVQGVGVDGKGVLINTVTGNAIVNNLVLSGDATFGGSTRLEVRGTPSFGSHTLTVNHVGNGAPTVYEGVRIVGSATTTIDHDLGDANIIQGTLAFHNATLGQASGTITIAHNPEATYITTLQLMDSNSADGYLNDITKNLIFTGGRLYNYRGQFTIHGAVTLNDMATEFYTVGPGTYSTATIIAANITGTGGITKTAAGFLTLLAANTYSGNTTVSAGTLILDELASISNSPVIDVQTGATFNVSAVAGGFTLADGQTLVGRGKVTGNVAAGGGSTVGGGGGIGRLTFENDLDMSAGANLVWEVGALVDGTTGTAGTDFDQLSVAGSLVLGGLSQLTLDFDLLAEEDRPGHAAPNTFWTSDHAWKIIDVGDSGSTTGDFSLIVGGTFNAGTFATSLDANDVWLTFTASITTTYPPGDANGDGKVDEADAKHLAVYWGTATKDPVLTWWQMGDFNGDGKVDARDASILAANWGDHTGGESTAAVPEPSVLVGLLALLAACMVRRRR